MRKMINGLEFLIGSQSLILVSFFRCDIKIILSFP
jgi:hypothetical protein